MSNLKNSIVALVCAICVSCAPNAVGGTLANPTPSSQSAATSLLKSVVSSATSGDNVTSLISNLISSVAGDVTTTKTSILGTWKYASPCVQFESENLLTKAGGTTIATSIENKLGTYFQKVGIKPGAMTFVFAEDGTVTYSVGSFSRQGTYTFDDSSKTITITTAMGQQVRAYVTVSGSNMGLTFDGSKLLTLMNTLGSKYQKLQTITAITSAYDGMKVGYRFTK